MADINFIISRSIDENISKLIPSLIYVSAKDDLPQWTTVSKEIKEYRDNDKEVSGIIFTEQGFWATQKQLDKLIKEKKIKIKENRIIDSEKKDKR